MSEVGEIVAQGVGLDSIIDLWEIILEEIGFVDMLDTIKFLAEGGRLPEVREWVKTMARIYPVLGIING